MSIQAGKTAVITGASQGIGEATARHLAGLGFKVVLAARSGDKINSIALDIKARGGTASAFTCDVGDHTAVAALIQYTQDTFGSVDLLVNNAGLIDPIARIADSDPGDWGNIIDVNVKGVYHGLR